MLDKADMVVLWKVDIGNGPAYFVNGEDAEDYVHRLVTNAIDRDQYVTITLKPLPMTVDEFERAVEAKPGQK